MSDLYALIDKLYDEVGHRGTGADPVDYTEKLMLVASAVEAMDYLLTAWHEAENELQSQLAEAEAKVGRMQGVVEAAERAHKAIIQGWRIDQTSPEMWALEQALKALEDDNGQ